MNRLLFPLVGVYVYAKLRHLINIKKLCRDVVADCRIKKKGKRYNSLNARDYKI